MLVKKNKKQMFVFFIGKHFIMTLKNDYECDIIKRNYCKI